MKENKLICPECDSDDILVYSMTSYEVNKDIEYFCESVKPHDSDAPACCMGCNWEGIRDQLIVKE